MALDAGCVPRQGETFDLSPDDVDLDARVVVHVVRQVKLVRGRLVFAPPKHGRLRDVPLPDSVADALRWHLDRFPPLALTLPWRQPGVNPSPSAC